MYKCSLFLFGIILSIAIGMISLGATSGNNNPPVYAWIGCDGTAVTRTEAGKIVMTHIAKNMTNCNGPKSTTVGTTTTGSTDPRSLNMFGDTTAEDRPRVTNKIILDLSQKDIVNYRVEQIKQEQIRYANAIRSVRIRSGKSLESDTK